MKSPKNNRNYSLIQTEGPSRITILDGPFEDVTFVFGKIGLTDSLQFEFEIIDGDKSLESSKEFTDYIFTILLELLESNLRVKYRLQQKEHNEF